MIANRASRASRRPGVRPGPRRHAPDPKRVSDMAYENRQLKSAIAWDDHVSALSSTNGNDALGRTEWSVIDMARDEGPRSANPNAFVNRLLSKLFGIAIARPLANDRLESLR